jgi:hypothetical protein
MITYGLAIAWNWEFDADFVFGIERQCALRGISTYRVDTDHLHHVLELLKKGKIGFQVLFDRASDADLKFQPLVSWFQQSSKYVINPPEHIHRAVDKAIMHFELISHGVHVPNSIILPPFNSGSHIDIAVSDLERIGIPFVIKPANTTGGGTGVVMNAKTLDDVFESRKHHKDDKYLLQETIIPKMLEGKRAWFRVYHVFGEIILCWWDDQTHMYTELHEEDEIRHSLGGLRSIMRTIQQACKLDFFSSEIAMTEERKFIVVDYVNEVCDMRLQSKYGNGAPDAVVHRIEALIATNAEKHIAKGTSATLNKHG